MVLQGRFGTDTIETISMNQTVKDQLSKLQYHFYARLSELFKTPI